MFDDVTLIAVLGPMDYPVTSFFYTIPLASLLHLHTPSALLFQPFNPFTSNLHCHIKLLLPFINIHKISKNTSFIRYLSTSQPPPQSSIKLSQCLSLGTPRPTQRYFYPNPNPTILTMVISISKVGDEHTYR